MPLPGPLIEKKLKDDLNKEQNFDSTNKKNSDSVSRMIITESNEVIIVKESSSTKLKIDERFLLKKSTISRQDIVLSKDPRYRECSVYYMTLKGCNTKEYLLIPSQSSRNLFGEYLQEKGPEEPPSEAN
eukprot:Awhi_evm1s450